MSSTKRIGFGKKIRLDWLALALRLRADGVEFENARETLSLRIAETNKGAVAITKAISNLRQVVFAPTPENHAFSEAGLELWRKLGDTYALEIAWGLSMTSYSFFSLTVETTGRLLRLNEEFSALDLVRRLSEKKGDRGFVDRVGRYNLSSLVDWGVLEATENKTYRRSQARRIRSVELAAWLMESVLRSSQTSSFSMQHLAANPMLFPFDLPVFSAVAAQSANPRLLIQRQNLNEEILSILDHS